jgi:putative ABC transport system permease protein
MLRNYWQAALAHASGNRIYAAINTAGLAIGVATAVLMFVIVRAELTHNDFIPNYRNTYLAVSAVIPPGHPADYQLHSHHRVAELLKLRFKEIQAITRLAPETVSVRNDDVVAQEDIYWADPNAFDVLDFPTAHGTLKQALSRPDGVVLTSSKAQKFFGTADAVGRRLEIEGHPMTVMAIIRDLPEHRTELTGGIIASGLASYSKLTRVETEANAGFIISALTYFRLAPSASPGPIESGAENEMKALWLDRPPAMRLTLVPLRLDRIHLFEPMNPGARTRIAFLSLIGGLVLFLACVNFVNLSTARSARRAVEVGVRKAAGATRRDLIIQFLGGSLVYVVLAMIIAVAAVELVLPQVNAFMGGGVAFEYWRDPAILASLGLAALLLTTIAGMYPALVLSSFRPGIVLRGLLIQPEGADALRRILVMLQFAILIGLTIAAAVIYRQREYATSDALRVKFDQVLSLDTACAPALVNELRATSGIEAVSCTGSALFTAGIFGTMNLRDGSAVTMSFVPIDSETFNIYGMKARAGRLFARDRDELNAGQETLSRWVINETAVSKLGFSSDDEAVGKTIGTPGETRDIGSAGEIIGVVDDFSLGSLRKEILPTAYVFSPGSSDQIHLKLDGQRIPEALQAIDRAWSRTAGDGSLNKFFVEQHIRDLYAADLRQAQVFAIFACVAVLLACLGLFGLSASTTERRVREIGLRKAMGASRGDIMKLLLWQFTKPVIWASLLAWPASGWLMSRWLDGFAYRIDLEPAIFLAATLAAIVVALLTVATHCYLVASSKTAGALKAE